MRRPKSKIKKIIVPTNCPFCKGKSEPHFLEVNVLKKYITERGKILSKDRTGLCARHQRHLAVQIKRARVLALMPYVVGL